MKPEASVREHVKTGLDTRRNNLLQAVAVGGSDQGRTSELAPICRQVDYPEFLDR